MDNNTEIFKDDEWKDCVLQSNIINKFNLKETKNNVVNMLGKFISLQYKYINITPPKITSNYELRYESFSSCNTIDKIGYYIEKKYDTELKAKEFFEELGFVMNKLNHDELVVLKLYLINNQSETIVADFIGVSRTLFRNIKDSCILKLALAFNLEVLK